MTHFNQSNNCVRKAKSKEPWKVMPEVFWRNPGDFEIDLPLSVINEGMKKGTLHKLIVKRALSKKQFVPFKVRKIYSL